MYQDKTSVKHPHRGKMGNYRGKSVWCTHYLVLLVGMLSSWQAGHAAESKSGSADFRITKYEELEKDRSVQKFSQEGIVDYSQITVDIPNQQVLVGARDHILRLALSNLNKLEVEEWRPTELAVTICLSQGQSRENCHNFIRVLLLHKEDQIFACGTYAFAPECTFRKVTKLKTVEQNVSGIAKCPYDPRHNTTAIKTADGNLYSATVTDFTGRDSAISRSMGPANFLRTVQYNSRWLNEPDFISSYEVEGFVYFFFRETAVEYINCGKSVYSRVARICKSDSGGNFLLEDNWTTFTKARLNCSLPGAYPFYFNELQSTYYDTEAGLVYGVFTTQPTSIYGSAVCVYSLTSFNSVFSGAFKYQESPQMAWTRKDNPAEANTCPHPSHKRSTTVNQTPQRLLVDAQKYQMMDQAAQPLGVGPRLVMEGQRFTHIAVDEIQAKHHEKFQVFFLATLEGAIRKMINLPGTSKTCVVEEVQVVPKDSPQPIRSLQLSREKRLLLVGTKDAMFRIPVENCDNYSTKRACLAAQDPYCGWDTQRRLCTVMPSQRHHQWHQNINSCPQVEESVDGGWADWSDWSSCRYRGETSEGEECVCRRRSCTNPVPKLAGRQCSGNDVEVQNCTVNGGWTKWSEWSACSATCGVALRSRRRSCSNPEPRFGGRVCVGSDFDEVYCHENEDCPPPPLRSVDGGWSEWSVWDKCSSKCGGGMQRRFRQCNQPEPDNDGLPCIGNEEQWRNCNTHYCGEVRKATEWTGWVRTNTSKEGYREERYRLICRAKVLHEDEIRTHIKTDYQECGENGEGCSHLDTLAVPDIDGSWSVWSQWTDCDAPCDGGRQWRERLCNNPIPSGNGRECQDHGREMRACNMYSCQGEWSCWSEFTACSVSCGQGLQTRMRNCRPVFPGGAFTIPCRGQDREEKECILPSCSQQPTSAWSEWTHWSVCYHDDTQQRKRQCTVPFPVFNQCSGRDLETRMCRYNAIEVKADAATSEEKSFSSKSGLKVWHLVIVGVICFILGLLVGFGLLLYCQRARHMPRGQPVPYNNYNTLQKGTDVKQNHYVSPSELDIPPWNMNSMNSMNINSKYYSEGSLKNNNKDPMKVTVNEATLKRDSLLRSNSMRTNLSLCE